jgi:Fe/S biogenesis protein NfuA
MKATPYLQKIKKFIDEDINPGLAMHGGYLAIEKFDEEHEHLYVHMGGGCQGCASSLVTLKLMIEGMLKEEFPKLREIEDVTNHSKGENPYYSEERR